MGLLLDGKSPVLLELFKWVMLNLPELERANLNADSGDELYDD